jgi:asparagine synthase (glutamine-hydrolysing)
MFGEIKRDAIIKDSLKHRGPDQFRSFENSKGYMEFYRLAINGISEEGMQPFVSEDKTKALICNGEMYNLYKPGESDCLHLMDIIDSQGMTTLRGDYAIIYFKGDRLLAARDPIGVRPLFYNRYKGGIAMASEMKALAQLPGKTHIFPPGHMYDSYCDQFISYFPLYWDKFHIFSQLTLKKRLIDSVKLRVLSAERPMGFLLSGGLDSSLIAALSKRVIHSKDKMKTFAIGKPDSPDVLAALKMAKYLDSDHTTVDFDFQEGLRVLKDVIWSLESYDVTTIRASVPMWLLSQYIRRETDIKVLVSGEGSDEIFGGYIYFHNAPNLEDFHLETVRRVQLLHQFDVLRADRCTAAHGLELRVPFLDRDFMDYSIGIAASVRQPINGIEKHILRRSFENELPADILWRPKNAFSDAVGYSWVDTLKAYTESMVSDEQFKSICQKAKGIIPLTKEEAYYRSVFWELFGEDQDHLISEIWRPRWTSVTDPSARHIGIKDNTT